MTRYLLAAALLLATSACGGASNSSPPPSSAETSAEASAETTPETETTTPAAATSGTAQTANAEGGNWLIGRWQPVDPACTTYQEVSFTPDSYTVTDGPTGWNPGTHTAAVSYTVSAQEAWMQTNGKSFRRFPIDADHFKDDDMNGCVWQRAS